MLMRNKDNFSFCSRLFVGDGYAVVEYAGIHLNDEILGVKSVKRVKAVILNPYQ